MEMFFLESTTLTLFLKHSTNNFFFPFILVYSQELLFIVKVLN